MEFWYGHVGWAVGASLTIGWIGSLKEQSSRKAEILGNTITILEQQGYE
jgi:hypothetical protein